MDNSGVGIIDNRMKDYTVILLFPIFLVYFSAKLCITISDSCTVSSLSTILDPSSERCDVMLDTGEAV